MTHSFLLTYHVATVCRVLGVSPSGFYAWCERPPCARTQADAALLAQIQTIHTCSRGTYGAPRVHAELREQGARCGRKRVARLMRAARLVGAHRRRRPRTTVRDRGAAPARDLVRRHFTTPHPDQLWVADITYVRTGSGWLYLAVVLDAFSRRVVGWAMSPVLETMLVLDALNMALWNRRPTSGVVHHSDRGTQYTSLAFGRRCREAGVVPSMGSAGSAYDNALAEAFFATLETELLQRQAFLSRGAARVALFDYIVGFYNSHRRHSALGYLAPAEFERRWHQEQIYSRGSPDEVRQGNSHGEDPRLDSPYGGRYLDTPKEVVNIRGNRLGFTLRGNRQLHGEEVVGAGRSSLSLRYQCAAKLSDASKEESTVTMLVIQHPVRDFQAWKKAFNSDPAGRAKNGVARHAIYRPHDDPNYVVVNLEFSSREQAQAFLDHPAMRQAWKSFLGLEAETLSGSHLRSRLGAEQFQARILDEIERVDY